MTSNSSIDTLPATYLRENTGYHLVNAAIALIVVQTIFVMLRVWARCLRNPAWTYADIFVPIAYLFNMAINILSILAVKHGALGQNIEAVLQMKPSPLPYFFKLVYIVIPIFYCLAVSFPKLAILDVYLHIFIDRFSRCACYITGLVIVLTVVVNVPTIIWQCSPVNFLWEQYVNQSAYGRCHNIHAHFLWGGFPNVVTDIVMLLIPIPVVRELQTSFRTKVGIIATFLVGSTGMIFSIIKFVAFTRSYANLTSVTVFLVIWANAEPAAYLVASCLLTLRPLLSYIAYDSQVASLFTAPFQRHRLRKLLRLNEDDSRNTFNTKRKPLVHNVEIPEYWTHANQLVPESQNLNTAVATAGGFPSQNRSDFLQPNDIQVEHEVMLDLEPAREGSRAENERPRV